MKNYIIAFVFAFCIPAALTALLSPLFLCSNSEAAPVEANEKYNPSGWQTVHIHGSCGGDTNEEELSKFLNSLTTEEALTAKVVLTYRDSEYIVVYRKDGM